MQRGPNSLGRQRAFSRSMRQLLRDDRGAAMIALTIYLPFFIGLTTLAVDMSNVLWTRSSLQVAAEAAALAATAKLPNNNQCSDQNSACWWAREYANRNMPNVLAESDVVVGKWTDRCANGTSAESCFEPIPAGASCVDYPFPSGTASCNAVKVTTRKSLNLTLAQTFGFGTFDVSATAIAVFGMGQFGAQPTWDVIIVQDVSPSFVEELPLGKDADRALLECMRKNAAPGSRMGITPFSGCAAGAGTYGGYNMNCTGLTNYRTPVNVTNDAGYNAVYNKIGDDPNNNVLDGSSTGLKMCYDPNRRLNGQPDPRYNDPALPPCTNTNIAAGIDSAYRQFCPSSPCTPPAIAQSRRAIVIVTDGEPVGHSINCGSNSSCTNTLKTLAEQRAADAAAAGIDVYTIWYGPNNNAAQWLRTLRKGNGLALETPDPARLPELMVQICATMPHRLVW